MLDRNDLFNERISVEEACDFLDCSASQLFKLLCSGEIPGVQYGRAWVIPKRAFIERVNSNALAWKGKESTPAPPAQVEAAPVAPPYLVKRGGVKRPRTTQF